MEETEQDDSLSPLLTLPAAGRALGVSRRALGAAVDKGELVAFRFAPGAWPRVFAADVRRWLASRRVKSAAS